MRIKFLINCISMPLRRTARLGIEAILIFACLLHFQQSSVAALSCPVEFVPYNGHCGFIGSNGKFRPVFKLTQANLDFSKQFVYSEFAQGRNPNWERAIFPVPIDRNLLAGSSNGSGSTSREKTVPQDGGACEMDILPSGSVPGQNGHRLQNPGVQSAGALTATEYQQSERLRIKPQGPP